MENDDERSEIAEKFREASRSDLDGTSFQAKVRDIIWPVGAPGSHGWRDIFIRLGDLIDYGEPDTCVYEPTESVNYYDENDREHETNRPSDGCPTFTCSRCGNEMLYGEMGWFDEEPPYTPRFKRCPECGRRVVTMTLYDRVVGDGK